MTTDAAALHGNHQGVTNGAVNEASPREGSPPASKHHKRTYQACEPCRNRKVRCDLGSVDAPSDPPCLRCRREKKHCYFTETRRKRKAGEAGGPELGGNGIDIKRDAAFPGGFVQRTEPFDEVGQYQKQSTSHGIARAGMPSTIIRPEGRGKSDSDEVRNHAAAALFQQPIHQPGDALRLLVDAASRTEAAAAAEQPDRPLPPKVESVRQPSNIDPAIVKLSDPELNGLDEPEQAKAAALKTWARLRYVRAGWFTPAEGMGYFEYFSLHLANLTPTPIPDFFDYRNHIKLLKEEPMLTVTLLTIASRYRKLSGPGGASRSIYIHSMMWRECQDMVTRMFWGQEHFGGMFGLASGFRADTGEPVKRGLRGLGTVEALLILSDWHPRSMHFPPASNNDDILAPLQSEWEAANRDMESRNPHQGWTEPAMRSDRMSWSLAGAAYNLSVELGVFDSMPEMGHFKPGYKTRAYDPQRADRIGRLVHIYVSQTSGRLGYPNMLPYNGVDLEDDFFKMRLEPVEDESDPEFQAEQMQRAWCELSAIMRRVNNELFRSKQQTLELIQSNKYIEVLESFWPVLKDWLKRVESITLPDLTRTLIMMEYEYSRTYINSLALQAQIEQYAELQNNDPAAASSESSALFSKTLVEISKKNAPYINEVVDSTRNLLRYVVDHLRPSGGLKHSPVRTIFRILSGAMFLLKTFALGSKESQIHQSLTLLQRTVEALRDTVVDDCHLSLRIADLLDSLIVAIGTKFVRVSINSKQGSSKRRRESLSSKPSALNTTETKAESPIIGKPPPTNGTAEGANGVNGAEMPFGARLVNPNDPNVVIMPPPDYAYNMPEHRDVYSQHHSPRTASSAGIQNGYPALSFGISANGGEGSQSQSMPSPTVGSAAGPVHPPMKFSPTPQNQQPFSPMSNGSSNGNTGYSYDWYAVDIHPLVNQAGGNMGNAQAGSMGGSVMAWGNMFGPEIGDGLEMLNVLTADTMPFDENVGWAA